jgi:hypothetical protein
MRTCEQDGCFIEVDKTVGAKGGRPRRYCSEHSSTKARAKRARGDVARYGCGCKASGRYAQCPQHKEGTDRIPWGVPDQTHPEYAAVETRRVRRQPLAEQAREVAEYVTAKMLTAHEIGPNRIAGQWMTERHSDGAFIRVIGQVDGYWDRDLVWHDSPVDWDKDLGFKVASPVAHSQLIRRGPEWADIWAGVAA